MICLVSCTGGPGNQGSGPASSTAETSTAAVPGTAAATASPSPSAAASPSPTAGPVSSPSPGASVTPVPSPSPAAIPSFSPTPTPTPVPSPTPTPTPITVTTSDYSQGKTALMSSVGGGTPVLTELDTGSDLLMVEQSFAGPQIQMTNIQVKIVYDHGNIPRSGTLGYTPYSLLENGKPVLTTSVMIPVVVVPDGVVNKVPSENHAIFGLRMSSCISPKLFFPSPFNQTVIIDRAHHRIKFGPFTQTLAQTFGLIDLTLVACPSHDTIPPVPPSPMLCWNDSTIMVDYEIEGAPSQPQTFASLFDSGAPSSFQFDPFPSWFKVTDFNSDSSQGVLRNKVTASVKTSKGSMTVFLTDPIAAARTGDAAGFVNCGNPSFQQYQVLLDQQTGRFGLIPASP